MSTRRHPPKKHILSLPPSLSKVPGLSESELQEESGPGRLEKAPVASPAVAATNAVRQLHPTSPPSKDDAIKETAALARQLLLDKKGKLRGNEHYLASLTLLVLIRPANLIGSSHSAKEGVCAINWQGRPMIYESGIAEILLREAREGDPTCDQLLCNAAAIMLSTGAIVDKRLRDYIIDRLTGATRPITKRKRGRSATNINRDNWIGGLLIPTLMQKGFSATRNAATEDAESACSIISKALKKINIKLGEKSVEAVWSKFSRFFDLPGQPYVLNK
jgi:hypothetical protein